jgi:hypothetical protein
VRRPVVIALACVLACKSSLPAPEATPMSACKSARVGVTKPMFHGDRARSGWNDHEPDLSPERVGSDMTAPWTSEPFATLERDGISYVGRAYASPLYADGVRIASGRTTGAALSVVFVATSNGDVYAISAFDSACDEGTAPAGKVLWRAHLVTPDVSPLLDARTNGEPKYGGIAIGVLATPVLDLASETLYVSAMSRGADDGALPVWKIFALDTSTGAVRQGWPVALSRDVIEAKNTNGPANYDDDARVISQRSALALSPDGSRVYVSFGGYWDTAVGWLVAVDTRSPSVVASFSGAPHRTKGEVNAGMWAPGGPAIDETGRVYVTTGNSQVKDGPAGTPGVWGNSMLRLTRDLVLESAYTPFDYCALDKRDIDIAGSSPILFPPSHVAFGGKAGVVYLLDRDRLPAAGKARRACATSFEDAERDGSLLPPLPSEPYCEGFPEDPCAEPIKSTRCVRGPLQVFGPPGDDASSDRAKMRTTPAFFRAPNGASYLFVAGSTKAKRCAPEVVAPSVVRLRVSEASGTYLGVDGADTEMAFLNPGSPVVSSDGGKNPVVWILDQNARRTQPLLDPKTPGPVLYAVDGTTMRLLWKTSPSELAPGGKYATPAIAHGAVFVATDRLYAFTVRPR